MTELNLILHSMASAYANNDKKYIKVYAVNAYVLILYRLPLLNLSSFWFLYSDHLVAIQETQRVKG